VKRNSHARDPMTPDFIITDPHLSRTTSQTDSTHAAW